MLSQARCSLFLTLLSQRKKERHKRKQYPHYKYHLPKLPSPQFDTTFRISFWNWSNQFLEPLAFEIEYSSLNVLACETVREAAAEPRRGLKSTGVAPGGRAPLDDMNDVDIGNESMSAIPSVKINSRGRVTERQSEEKKKKRATVGIIGGNTAGILSKKGKKA